MLEKSNMKAYFLIALLFPVLCYAQKERSTSQQRPPIDDCPTWSNKPKSSKVAYFEQARLGKKNTKPVQTPGSEIREESEHDKLARLNRNRKIIPETPFALEERTAIPKKEKSTETVIVPLEKEVGVDTDKKEKPVETPAMPLEKKEVITDKTENKQAEETVLKNDGTTITEKPKKIGKEKKERKKIRKRKTLSNKKTKTPRSKKQKCPEF